MRFRYFLIIFLGLGIINPVLCQNLDSLKSIITENPEDICLIAKAANQLSNKYVSDNTDSTLYYYQIAKSSALECKDDREIAYADIIYGAMQQTQWPLDSIVDYFEEILEREITRNQNDLQAMIHANIGREYMFHGDYESGIESSIKALNLYDQLDFHEGRVVIGYNLGVAYYSLNQYELAIEKFHEGIHASQKIGNLVREAYCLNGIANSYSNMSVYDSSLVYTQKVKEIADLTNNAVLQAVSRTSMGTIYGEQNNYESAAKEYKDAIPFLELYGNEILLVTNYCNLAAALSFLENYKDARFYIDKAYESELAENNPMVDEICLKIRAIVYEHVGDFKNAAQYFSDYIDYQDSFLLKENKLVLAELEEKYESSKKDAELQKQELEIQQKTTQRNNLIGGLGFISLLGGSLIWGIYSRMNRNKKIAMQEKELQNQKINALEQNQKLLSISSLLEGQETERIRIAKDLHDGLGGLLTTVKAHFGKIQTQIQELENLDIYQSASTMIDKAHDEVRRISHNLMPADLRAGGLPLAIRQIAHELRHVHDKKVDFECIGLDNHRFSEKIELFIYRVTQELVNNIVRHADASEVFIQIAKSYNDIVLIVEDNGKGFNLNEALMSNGLGLQSVYSRIEQIGGIIDVDTRIGQGSTFTINISIDVNK